jgi:hypothetical protein
VCVRACVRVCVRACVRACVCVCGGGVRTVCVLLTKVLCDARAARRACAQSVPCPRRLPSRVRHAPRARAQHPWRAAASRAHAPVNCTWHQGCARPESCCAWRRMSSTWCVCVCVCVRRCVRRLCGGVCGGVSEVHRGRGGGVHRHGAATQHNRHAMQRTARRPHQARTQHTPTRAQQTHARTQALRRNRTHLPRLREEGGQVLVVALKGQVAHKHRAPAVLDHTRLAPGLEGRPLVCWGGCGVAWRGGGAAGGSVGC